MQVFDLKGEVRNDLGKKATKAVRYAEKVPCVLYGGEANVHFAVLDKDLKKLLYTPNVYLVNLDLDGKSYGAVMRDIQFHPVKDNILHVDFYQIDEAKPIVMEVPVQLEGLAEGVKAGGRLAASVRKLKVKSVYTQIPERLNIDVTSLGLGKTIKVGELHFDGLELVTSKEVVVCQVKMTRSARSAASADN